MLNHLASLAMSTSDLKALAGKLDIKRHSPSILYTLRVCDHLLLTVKLNFMVSYFADICFYSQ